MFGGKKGTKKAPERSLRRLWGCKIFLRLPEFLEEEGFDLAVQHQQQPQRGNISDTETVELVHGELVAALFDLVLYKFSADLIGHHEGHQ